MAIMPSPPTASSRPVDEDTGASISTVHPDIIQSHVLTRLDGPALASVASASSQLRRLCTEQNLWRKICTSAWPSLENPLVRDVVSTFPGGYRSIFSDSFPSLHHASPVKHPSHSFPQSKYISAVDLYFQDKPIFSKVQWIETGNVWFLSSPLWVELLEPEELAPTPVKYVGRESKDEEEWLKHIEENMSLSCILIDPTQKRSANISSRSPVSVQRHWLTRDLEIIFAVVMVGDEGTSEFVQCTIKVTCGGKVGGDMHVREVSLMVEDMDGRHVSGRESMVILQWAIENGSRKKLNGEEAKESYEKFLNLKSKRRERKLMREKAMDMLAIFIAISIFALFCWFVFF